jgi:hypothetical protein
MVFVLGSKAGISDNWPGVSSAVPWWCVHTFVNVSAGSAATAPIERVVANITVVSRRLVIVALSESVNPGSDGSVSLECTRKARASM